MKKGFTLIELLVVIAIIAILAGIIFPVFSQAREKARQTSCLSNMKQISTAIMLYVDDNHETYPRARKTYENTWLQAIYPYLKNAQIFYCPSSWINFDKSQDDLVLLANDACNGNYSANVGLIGDGDDPLVWPVKKLARVKSPSNTVAIIEGGWYCTFPSYGMLTGYSATYLPGMGLLGFTSSTYPSALGSDAQNDWDSGRHNEGFNIAYADGHASYEKCDSFLSSVFNSDKSGLVTSKNPFIPASW